VKLATTIGGAGVVHGDLTAECAAAVAAVLDALAAPAGKEDDRTRGQRYHDALQEAMRQLGKCIVTCITQCGTRNSRHSLTGLPGTGLRQQSIHGLERSIGGR
jgi:hypothetical protein